MKDAACVLQPLVTKTASFTSASYDLGTRSPLGGHILNALIDVSAYAATAGATAIFSLQESADNATWTDLTATTAGASNLFTNTSTSSAAPTTARLAVPFVAVKRYVRLVMTVAGGATNQITYSAYITITRQ